MNDPSKSISVNLSSLHSLKAELLRKQEEVNRTKSSRTINTFVPKKSTKPIVDKSEKNTNESSDLKIYEYEDTALLDKSRLVLEAKSKFYSKMSGMGGKLNSDDNCLVLFNQKKQELNIDTPEKSLQRNSDESSEEDGSSSDDEYIEYTDCLGRSRRVLKKKLEDFKKKDKELADNMEKTLDQSAPRWFIDTTPRGLSPTPSDNFSIMSKHDEMRCNWERKEEENMSKENVHYQDVFFDEARQHGVGYYAFSTDDKERNKQQKELEEIRKKTVTEQEERNAVKKFRENIIAERVKAAKNRQRARVGLPPIEDDSKGDDLIETKTEKKKRKQETKEKRRKEKEDKKKEIERLSYVRPWDRNKNNENPTPKIISDTESEEWKYIPEKTPMSQEQWNELKRSERNTLFAPVPEKCRRTNFENQYIKPSASEPHCNISESVSYPSSSFVQFQTTKRQGFQKRNYTSSDSAFSTQDPTTFKCNPFRGAAIPPPANLAYEKPLKFVSNNDLEASIEAGLNFIRNKSDKETLSSKSSWTAKNEY